MILFFSSEKLLQPWRLPKSEEKVASEPAPVVATDESKDFAEVDALLKKAKLVMEGNKRGAKTRPATAAEERPKPMRKPPVPRQLDDANAERMQEVEEVMADHMWEEELLRYDQLYSRLSADPLLAVDHIHAAPPCSEEEGFIDALFGEDGG